MPMRTVQRPIDVQSSAILTGVPRGDERRWNAFSPTGLYHVQRRLPITKTIPISLPAPQEPLLQAIPGAAPRRVKPEWTQQPLRFKNFPPQPRRNHRPLPLWLLWAQDQLSQQFQQGAWRDERAEALLPLVKALPCDGAVYSRDWRLELVWLKRGYPHYRLYFRSYVFGKVDLPAVWGKNIKAARDLDRLQRDLAAYLVGCGFTAHNSHPVDGDARTRPNATKRSIHRLFV
jgi:hypothetical protein